MVLRCATSSCWRRKFSVFAQMSELSRKTVSKLLTDCSKWLRPKLVPKTVLDRRTNSFMVSADRRCRRPPAAEARTQGQDIIIGYYDGARPCRHLKTWKKIWNIDMKPCRTREFKTACGHMMPPQQHVCNGLACPDLWTNSKARNIGTTGRM